MNTEIQTGGRFENSCPYSNMECSSVCAISSFDCHERSVAEVSAISRVQKRTELLLSSGDFWFEFLMIHCYEQECPIQPIGFQGRTTSVTGQVSILKCRSFNINIITFSFFLFLELLAFLKYFQTKIFSTSQSFGTFGSLVYLVKFYK